MSPHRAQFLPSAISLYITYRCHLRCPHCFLVEGDLLNRHELSLSDIKAVIDDASAHNVFLLVLSGGEPLMHPDIDEILVYARSRRLLPLVGITGVKVSDEHIDAMVRAGVPSVQVSLDGHDSSTHDAIRGPGTFDEVVSNIQRLQARGFLVNVAVCVHRSNLGCLPGFFARMAALGVARVKMAFYRSFDANAAYEALDFDERQHALAAAREFLAAADRPDWIACPTHDVATGTELRQTRRHPSLAIGADGFLREGEGGVVMGRLAEGLPSTLYARHVEKRMLGFFDRLIKRLLADHQVSELAVVDAGCHPDAWVYRRDGRVSILIKSGLPLAWHYFSILHELGHLATRTLVNDPAQAPPENELRANQWALNVLKPHLDKAAVAAYEAAVLSGYRALRELIVARLFRDIVRYG